MLVISGVVPRSRARPGRDPRPSRPAGPALEGHRLQPLGDGPGGASGGPRPRAGRLRLGAPAPRAHRDRARRPAARRRRRRVVAIPAPAGPPVADPQALDAAAERLAAAERPLILLGGGAADAGDAALEIARRIGAPVGLTINGRGAIDHDDPLCLGSALSFAPVDGVLRDADAVLLAGAELSDLELWGLSEPLELHGVIRVDIDAGQLDRRYPAEIGLLGDAVATLTELAAAHRRRPATTGSRGPRRASPTCAAASSGRRASRTSSTSSRRSTRRCRPTGSSPRTRRSPRTPRTTASRCTAAARGSCRSATAAWAARCRWRSAPSSPRRTGRWPRSPATAASCSRSRSSRPRATWRSPLPIVVYDNSGYGEIRDAMDESGIPNLGTDIIDARPARDRPRIRRRRGARDGRRRSSSRRSWRRSGRTVRRSSSCGRRP